MISRRSFVATLPLAIGASGVSLGGAAAAALDAAHAVESQERVWSKYVKIRIGTGGHGHTYPGATVPFGMVQVGPDTFNYGWDHCSGYNYADNSIMGFSHTHLSGTGIGDMLDVLLMPGTGEVKTEPSSLDTPERGYRSRFSHDREIAEPGYYSVYLRDCRTLVELSATARAAIHRYTFPRGERAHFILDLTHAIGSPGAVMSSMLRVQASDTVVGSRKVGRWAEGREIYFAMKFSRPFDRADIIANNVILPSEVKEGDAKSLKTVLHYMANDGDIVLVKTGISGVSIEAALRNLDAEIPTWDFEHVRENAADQWEQELSCVKVDGGTERQKEIFYTALYHCMLAPTLFDDVDGTYRGMDGAVHSLAKGEQNYSTYSLWDTYRALHPLLTLIQPNRVPSLVNCLVRMSIESPAGLPVWPLQAKETGCMSGYHSVVVIAEAIQKGFKGIDPLAAYLPMKKRVFEEDYRGLALYRNKGYIPCDLVYESIGKGMDYAYDDWAVAHVAAAAGRHEDAALLRKRAGNYRNYFDWQTGFMRPRLDDGNWAQPFVPAEIGHSDKWRDYTESNAWQATFAVQHDPKGLAGLLGGTAKLEAKLDQLFTVSSALPTNAPVDIAGLVGQYAHGNEPSHHIAYLYAYSGQPYKTQERVAALMEAMYENQPDGIAGNEDCGQMSAWYVMSALGFYPVDPVSANYVLGTPLFDRVRIACATGKPITITAKRESIQSIYIRSVSLNGAPLTKAWFSHKDIADGGDLVFYLSDNPNQDFGKREETFPPSRSSSM